MDYCLVAQPSQLLFPGIVVWSSGMDPCILLPHVIQPSG